MMKAHKKIRNILAKFKQLLEKDEHDREQKKLKKKSAPGRLNRNF